MANNSYVNYFEILGLPETCKPGEVRRTYKRKMKDLVLEIARQEITEGIRNQYLLSMAQLNAAFHILNDNKRREEYVADRTRVMQLEEEWQNAAKTQNPQAIDKLRRDFDQALRHFLSVYMEELMLEAGRNPECVEASHWDPYHERHASRVLRHYRQQLYHEIHERLPFYDVTQPEIDWEARRTMAKTLITGAAGA